MQALVGCDLQVALPFINVPNEAHWTPRMTLQKCSLTAETLKTVPKLEEAIVTPTKNGTVGTLSGFPAYGVGSSK
jgi:hypothetical protein